MALPAPYLEDSHYIVIFKLHKINASEISMVVETGFVIDEADFRYHLLTDKKNKDRWKPFTVLLKNVFSGRAPFEGKAKKNSKKAYKKKKKERQRKKEQNL
ncbi:conserved protein of unknown function [Shewanella benthica]|uniref:Uncharacterized protein n=1 Tax=Shewanella benthica TaxID=43661 RepID=A0A330LYF1_9GAMM|nr:hypothetical protein [Shewanella benthica]SQH74203.1 conserved protein of unknown function [Shewanella benthica]